MNLQKLNENLNIHQSLPDNPNLTSEDLKKKFDEAGNVIKKFLNDLLIPDIESKVPEEITSQIKVAVGKLEKKIEDLKKEFGEDLETFKEQINKLIKDNLSKSTNYEDFVITTNNNQLLETNIQYGQDTKTPTFTKEGYKPLAMVGWTTTNKEWNISEVYTKSIIESSITVYIRGNSMPNHGNIYDSTTVSVHLLWVKIK